MSLLRLIGRHRQVDHAEVELRRLAQDFLQPGGILQARHLNENAIGAFPLDRRLDKAELVDAAFYDLDRLIDGLAHPLGDGRVGGAQRDSAAVRGHRDGPLPGAAGKAGDRLRQFLQLGERGTDVGIARDVHFDAVTADGAAGEWNTRLPQDAQHIIVDRLQLLLAHRRRIDLQQQMRAALQVEPEHNMPLRPARPMPDHVLRKEIGQGEKAYDESQEQNRRRLPAREKQHGSGFPYLAAPLCSRDPITRQVTRPCRPLPARLSRARR